MEDESDASSSGGDWDGDDDDDIEDNIVDDEDEDDAEMSDDEPSVANDEEDPMEAYHRPKSLVVSLRYRRKDEIPAVITGGHPSSHDFMEESQSTISIPDVKAGTKKVRVESRAEPSIENRFTGSANIISATPNQHLHFHISTEDSHGQPPGKYMLPGEDHLMENL